MKTNPSNPNDKANHAPGAGSDKHHEDTPSDADERFKKQEKEDTQRKNLP